MAVESPPSAEEAAPTRRRRRRRPRWWSPAWLWRHRSGRRRRRRFDVRLRRRRRSQRRAAWAAGGVVVLLALAGMVAARDALRIRGSLLAAQSTLQQAVDDPSGLSTDAGRRATLSSVDSALVSIDDARRELDRSTVFTVAGALPVLRAQRAALVDLVDDSAGAAATGRQLLARVDELADRNQIRDGRVPVEGLGELGREVDSAGRALSELLGRGARPWGPIGDARRRFDEVVGPVSSRLNEAADALGAARSFVGGAGERRYLVALQNNAEMRDQGAVLSYVVVRFSGGRLAFERRGSVLDLVISRPAPTELPPGTREVFGFLAPTQTWQSVNATADFSLSGRTMAAMYRQATGQPVDGVIAIDVPGLAAVLRAIGPVVVEGIPEPIGPENAGRVLLKDLYDGLPPVVDQSARKEKLGEVVSAVVTRLTSQSHDAVVLGRELGAAAAGGHLKLWSADEGEEQTFRRTGLGGGPAAKAADRTFHLAVQNRTATKLDYYVKPSILQEVRLTRSGTATVRTTVTLANEAPPFAAPSYQLGPDLFTARPGDYLGWVLLWGPAGSIQASGGVAESGLNLSQRVIDVAAAQRREVVFETIIPDAVRDGRLELRLVPQPRLEPVMAEIRLTADGWQVSDALTWRGPLDQVRNLTWGVSR